MLTPHTMARATALTISGLALVAGPVVAQHHAPHAREESLGQVDFHVSCEPDAEASFQRATALLHHMMYARAEREFEVLAERHPGCAMAHWGIAMTQFQPLWPGHPDDDALERGRAAIGAARERGLATDREQAYVAALDAFYGDPAADGPTRLRSFDRAMADLHQRFPDDLDAAAFHALALLATAAGADDPAGQRRRAANVLATVHDRSPTHPGAIHYAIHAHDVDGLAEGGVRYASAYGEIAPEVPHALHMPSHIHVRLGNWDEVIRWNEESAAAALNHPAGDHTSHHYPHALDYLVYAHLQHGDEEAAMAVLEELRTRTDYQPTFISGYALAAIPARIAVERRAWDEAATLSVREPATFPWDRFPGAEAMTHYARGLGSARTGDLAGAREALERLDALKANAARAGDTYWANQIEVQRLSLAAWMANAAGHAEHAVRDMRAAADLAGTMEKDPVTPGDLQPPYELLGDLLLDLGRPDEALRAYETSLETWPARRNSLSGAKRAAEAAGATDRAASYDRALAELRAGGR